MSELVPEERVRDDTLLVAGREQQAPMVKRRGGPIPFLRNIWRQLTSMRTALILLFLLGLASLPGALLPQWSLNTAKTAQYILDHGGWGRLLDRLGFFDVFASPWYAAIYLLLFTSLVGCLVPRCWEFVGALRAKPVSTPRNLSRLPLHETTVAAGDPGQIADRVVAGLRGWRIAVRDEPDGVKTVSAEKGYLREIGNLVFHLSLLGLLVAIAVGKMFGYEGSVIVNEGDGFCSSSPVAYDNFRPGLLVDGTDLAPFCLQVDKFTATYTDAGQANSFQAKVRYQATPSADPNGPWTPAIVEVNDPLRLDGERVYLLGHGYSPRFTVTYPDGTKQTRSAPFQPMDSMFTSQGAVKFTDPPGATTDEQIRKDQLAIVGIFAPSAIIHGGVMTSSYPAPEQPGVAVQVFKGDLGMETGRAQSVFAIDQSQVDKGVLKALDRANLAPGESMKVSDGSVVTFDGYTEWVSLQTSYDPAQGWALVCAILLLGGLMLSLTIKRRRVWYRIRPAGGSSGSSTGVNVEIGGLARTDQAGYGEEFGKLVALARKSS